MGTSLGVHTFKYVYRGADRILYNTVVADVVLVIMDEMVAERMLAGIILRAKFRWAVRFLSCSSRCGHDAISNFLWPLYLFHWNRSVSYNDEFFSRLALINSREWASVSHSISSTVISENRYVIVVFSRCIYSCVYIHVCTENYLSW